MLLFLLLANGPHRHLFLDVPCVEGAPLPAVLVSLPRVVLHPVDNLYTGIQLPGLWLNLQWPMGPSSLWALLRPLLQLYHSLTSPTSQSCFLLLFQGIALQTLINLSIQISITQLASRDLNKPLPVRINSDHL